MLKTPKQKPFTRRRFLHQAANPAPTFFQPGPCSIMRPWEFQPAYCRAMLQHAKDASNTDFVFEVIDEIEHCALYGA